MTPEPTIRKVPADSVPYGTDITRRGGYVYATYDGDRLVCIAATAPEARRKYIRAREQERKQHSEQIRGWR